MHTIDYLTIKVNSTRMFSIEMRFHQIFLFWSLTRIDVEAFVPTVLINKSFKSVTSFHASSSTETAEQSTQLQGVDEFEQWFVNECADGPDNDTSTYVKHGIFSNGRGLEFVGNEKDVLSNGKAVITLPKSLVLQSIIVEDKEILETIADDWDSVLALQLLRECKKGKQSDIYGYCMLLTRGIDFNSKDALPAPPSTAAHCIRNWTKEQTDVLNESKRGSRLVQIQEKQSMEWRDKYNALPAEDRDGFVDTQFYWAMEAVNSRAFKGDFGGENVLKKLSKFLVPFAAVAFALNYIQSGPFASDERITVGLLAFSCAPVVLNFISETFGLKTTDAVLLPYIDSANHLEAARSNIEFDPLKGVFTVCVEGRNCIVEDDNGMKQFYVSYGEKRDTELLLNYGFLPEMKEIVTQDETGDEIRRYLAETFNARKL